MDINHEILRKQVMISQFCNQVGCNQDTATKILQAAHWQIEVAFSIFFQDHSIVTPPSPTIHNQEQQQQQQQQQYVGSGQNSIGSRTAYACVPTNTPATPPSLPDTLAAFAQMKASSPDQRDIEPRIVQVQGPFGDY